MNRLGQMIKETRQTLEQRRLLADPEVNAPAVLPEQVAKPPTRKPTTLPAYDRSKLLKRLSSDDIPEFSDQLLAPLEAELSKKAWLLLETLTDRGVWEAQRRGLARLPTQITFHVPQDVLFQQLGKGFKSPHTRVKYLSELKSAGLLDWRPQITYCDGLKCTGTIFGLKLHNFKGKPARLRREDFKHKWRDLAGDIETGHTAYKFKNAQTLEGLKVRRERLTSLQNFELSRSPSSPPLIVSVHFSLECVLDAPFVHRSERAEYVDQAARACARALGDHLGNLGLYRDVLWNMLRLYVAGIDTRQQVHTLLKRAQQDHLSGFARNGNAGALFVAELKRSGLWEQLKNAPPYQVTRMKA